MKMSGSLFLVGPMGAGKSTIGRQLAKSLSCVFLDSDKEVEERTGVGIPLIFELEGETGFRARERAVIDELTRLPGIVLATGGGAVLDSENRDLLSARGVVVYLETSLEQQLARTRNNRDRPLLEGSDDIEATLKELMQERDPFYRKIADLVVTTGDQPARKLAREIVESLESIGTAEL
jgi:shikimate kinase